MSRLSTLWMNVLMSMSRGYVRIPGTNLSRPSPQILLKPSERHSKSSRMSFLRRGHSTKMYLGPTVHASVLNLFELLPDLMVPVLSNAIRAGRRLVSAVGCMILDADALV